MKMNNKLQEGTLRKSMNREDYVSNDVACVLKDNGYDIPSMMVHIDRTYMLDKYVTTKDISDGDFLIPSLYEAQKWLRKKELEVSANFDTGEQKWFSFVMRFDSIESLPEWMSESIYETYEEALNDGIKHALLKTINDDDAH